jgi:hypothetical protein
MNWLIIKKSFKNYSLFSKKILNNKLKNHKKLKIYLKTFTYVTQMDTEY